MKSILAFMAVSLLIVACGGRSSISNVQRTQGQKPCALDAAAPKDLGPEQVPTEALSSEELEAARRELSELQKAKTAGELQQEEKLKELEVEIQKAQQKIAETEAKNAEKDRENRAAIDRIRKEVNGVELQYKHSGKCLEVDGASFTDGVRAVQNACNKGQFQRFQVVSKTGGYQLINAVTGKCLGPQNGGTLNTTPVVQSPCTDTPIHLFEIQSDSNGYYFVKHVGSGRCVDIEAISTFDRAGAQLYDCLNGDAQRIKFIAPASVTPGP